MNFVAILEKTGEIMYFAGGGPIPLRTQLVEGVYPKYGWIPQNKWKGKVPLSEMPYLINPESGYIVSCNNHMASDKTKHGITQSFTFPGRKTRLSELIEETIQKKGGKIQAKDMYDLQTDLLDVQARASLPDMLYLLDNATLKLSGA